jgi:hypothetical protein
VVDQFQRHVVQLVYLRNPLSAPGSPCRLAQRLRSHARSRGRSMNKSVEQLAAQVLSAWDTENHFRAIPATG